MKLVCIWLYTPCSKDAADEIYLYLDYQFMRRRFLNALPCIGLCKMKRFLVGHFLVDLLLCTNFITNPVTIYIDLDSTEAPFYCYSGLRHESTFSLPLLQIKLMHIRENQQYYKINRYNLTNVSPCNAIYLL